VKKFRSIGCAVFMAALFSTTLLTAGAQEAKSVPPATTASPLPPVPRTADGHPDLNGVWESTMLSITLEAGRASGDPISPIVRTAFGGPPPYTLAAKPKHDEYVKRQGIDDPMTRCLPVGVPRITIQPMPFQIVQTPGKVVILYEYFSLFRVIPTDGSPHPSDAYPTFMGDSVAHWEGDTLVVDVTQFNDKTWLTGVGTYHSEALHVTERFTRTDYNTISYDAVMEDSQVFTKPWAFHSTLILRPNDRLLEFACMEGNEDMIFIQTLRDKDDKAKQEKSGLDNK
jgi:hypothetical protein